MHAGLRPFDEDILHLLCVLIVAPDVVLQVDVMLCLLQILHKARIELIGVLQDFLLIKGGQHRPGIVGHQA